MGCSYLIIGMMTFHAGLRMCVYCVDVILFGYNFAFSFLFRSGIGIKFCRHNSGKGGRNSGITINEDSSYVWLKTLEKFILSSGEDLGSPQWYLRDRLDPCCTKD